MDTTQYSKTRLRLGVPGVELREPHILQAFVESGLLPPDVPLTNHSVELRLWVPWPEGRKDFSLYKINPTTGMRYGGASGLMLEVRHTETNFYPQLPDTVWEETRQVDWQMFSEHVEDFINIIIGTQHLRQRDWTMLPEGDPFWIDYFDDLHQLSENRTQKRISMNTTLLCPHDETQPLKILSKFLHDNVDLAPITVVVKEGVEVPSDELEKLLQDFSIKVKIETRDTLMDKLDQFMKKYEDFDNSAEAEELQESLGEHFDEETLGALMEDPDARVVLESETYEQCSSALATLMELSDEMKQFLIVQKSFVDSLLRPEALDLVKQGLSALQALAESEELKLARESLKTLMESDGAEEFKFFSNCRQVREFQMLDSALKDYESSNLEQLLEEYKRIQREYKKLLNDVDSMVRHHEFNMPASLRWTVESLMGVSLPF